MKQPNGTATIVRIELWHGLLLLATALTLGQSGFIELKALLIGGLFMGVNFSAHLENHYFLESSDAPVSPIPNRWIVLRARIFNSDTGDFCRSGDLLVK
jgi:hypothetical protein